MGPPPRAISPTLLAVAAAAAAATLLWRVAVEPVDVGYVRYLGIADEIARSGDWVVLRKVDLVYLLKPPLFFWIMAVPIALLGEAPSWVAHLPDLAGLALSLFCVHRLAAAVYGRGEPALAGMLVFATTWETFSQVSGKRIDPLFAAFLTAAFAAFYLGSAGGKDGKPRAPLLIAAWLCVALATLTKGPLGILFFLLVAGLWGLWTGRLSILGSRGSRVGVALLMVLTLVWPVLLLRALGLEETQRIFGRSAYATRTGQLGLYATSLLVQQIPWTAFLPALAFWLARRRPWASHAGVRFFVVWFGAIFFVLHFSGVRHQRYLLPASPALSLLLLSLWYEPGGGAARLEGTAAALRRGAAAVCFGLLALAGAAAGVGLLLLEQVPLLGREIPPERWLAAPFALAVAVGALLALRSLGRGGVALQSPLPLSGLLLGVLTVLSVMGAGDLRLQDRIPLARAALAPVTEGRPAALLGLFEEQHQMTRLLTRRQVPLLANAGAVAEWLGSQPQRTALVLTSDAGRRSLEALPGLDVRIAQDFELAQEPVELLEVRKGT
jgi:4-amino-4-deoxy-L-arabinose transferase-like glycosyltransferase